MFRVLSNQHYPHRANQKLRSWANAVFQNRGVCGQAFPSFPSPFPVIPFFLLSSQLSRRTRAETLATQATDSTNRQNRNNFVPSQNFNNNNIGLFLGLTLHDALRETFLKVTLHFTIYI